MAGKNVKVSGVVDLQVGIGKIDLTRFNKGVTKLMKNLRIGKVDLQPLSLDLGLSPKSRAGKEQERQITKYVKDLDRSIQTKIDKIAADGTAKGASPKAIEGRIKRFLGGATARDIASVRDLTQETDKFLKVFTPNAPSKEVMDRYQQALKMGDKLFEGKSATQKAALTKELRSASDFMKLREDGLKRIINLTAKEGRVGRQFSALLPSGPRGGLKKTKFGTTTSGIESADLLEQVGNLKKERVAIDKLIGTEANQEKEAARLKRAALTEKRRIERDTAVARAEADKQTKARAAVAEQERGREILRRAGGPKAISTIEDSQLQPAIASLESDRKAKQAEIDRLTRGIQNREAALKKKTFDTSTASGKKGYDAVAKSLRNHNAKLVEAEGAVTNFDRALSVGKARRSGFTTWAHQTAVAVRLFLRYALGFGALYKLTNAVRALTLGLVDLDKALVSIQAIAGTSNQEIAKIGSAIKQVAITTQFSIAEIAKSAQVLAQAGVKPDEIQSALRSVALFASATNTTLETSADLISTMRNVFSDLSDRTIADQLTKAVNLSKLTGDDLKTILSRGLQVTKAFNISSEQYLAAVTTLKNAGIKASTVSTGLRQATLEILSPDKKTLQALERRYKELGESLSSGEVKERFLSFSASSNPLLEALKELRRLGASGTAKGLFSRVFDVRAQNVIQVLLNNLDEMNSSMAQLSGSGAAAAGAQKQMESLTFSMDNLGASVLSLADTISGNLVSSLAEGVRGFTDLVQGADNAILKFRALSGEGGAGIIRTTAAGAAAGFALSSGSLPTKLAAGFTGAVAGATGNVAARNTFSPGTVVALEWVISAATWLSILFSATKGKNLAPDKLIRGMGALKKTKTISKLATIVASIGGLFTGILSALGPVGKILGVVWLAISKHPVIAAITAFQAIPFILDFLGLFNKEIDDAAAQLKAAREIASRNAAKRQAAVESLVAFNPDQEGTQASIAEDAKDTLEKYSRAMSDALKISPEEVEELKEFIDPIGVEFTDALSEEYKRAIESLEKELGKALAPEQTKKLAELNSSANDARKKIEGLIKDYRRQLVTLSEATDLQADQVIILNALLEEVERGGLDLSSDLKEMLESLIRLQKGIRASAIELESTSGIEERRSQRRAVDLEFASILKLKDDKLEAKLVELADTLKGEELLRFQTLVAAAKSQERIENKQLTVLEEISEYLKANTLERINEIRSRRGLEPKEEDGIRLNSPETKSTIERVEKAVNTASEKELQERVKSEIQLRKEVTDAIETSKSFTKEEKEFLKPPDIEKVFIDQIGDNAPALTPDATKFIRDVGSIQRQRTQEKETERESLEREIYESPEALLRAMELNADLISDANRNRNYFELVGPDGLLAKKAELTAADFDAQKKLLRSQIDNAESGGKAKFEKKLETVRRRELRVIRKQVREEDAAEKSFDLKKRADLQKSIDATIGKTLLEQNDYLRTSKEYNALQDKIVALGLERIALQEQINVINGEEEETARRRAENAKEALLNEQQRKRRRDAIDDANYQSSLAASPTKEEAVSQALGRGPVNIEGQVSRLKSEQAALIAERSARVDFAAVGDNATRQSTLEINNLTTAIQALQAQINNFDKSGFEQLADGFDADILLQKTENLGSSVQNLGNNVSDILVNSFDQLGDTMFAAFEKGANAGEVFKTFLIDLVKQIGLAIVKALILKAVTSVIGLFSEGGEVSKGGQTFQTSSVSLGNIGESVDFARGGIIKGPGTGTSDSIPAIVTEKGKAKGLIMVSNEEAILNARATKALGTDGINALNSTKLRKFQQGGTIGEGASASSAIGTDVFNIEVNVATEMKGDETRANDRSQELGKKISSAVRKEIVIQKRPGGILA